MERNDILQKFVVDESGMLLFNRTKTESIENNVCFACGKEANIFNDYISKKEYGISGLCQKCQDEVFI